MQNGLGIALETIDETYCWLFICPVIGLGSPKRETQFIF